MANWYKNKISYKKTLKKSSHKNIVDSFDINGLKVSNDVYGFHNGQMDALILATYNNVILGRLFYCVYEEEVFIKHIEVADTHKRRGIGTKMLEYLKESNPGLSVEVFGNYATEEGSSFLKNETKSMLDVSEQEMDLWMRD